MNDILECDTDGIEVYHGKTTLEEAQFLYHATKQNDKDTDRGMLISADLEVGYDGTENTRKYEVTAELIFCCVQAKHSVAFQIY